MHQITYRRGMFCRTDGVITHHAFKTFHGPRAMEGEHLVKERFAIRERACFVDETAPRTMKGPFGRTGVETIVFLLETS